MTLHLRRCVSLFVCLSLLISACSPNKSSKAGRLAIDRVELAYNLRSDGGKVFENKFLVEAGKPIKQIGGMECVTTKNGNTTCTDKDKTTKYEFGKVELCNDKGAGCRDFRSGETSAPCKPSDKSKDACRPMSLRTKTGAGTGEGEEEGKKKETVTGEEEGKKKETVTGEGEGGGTKKEKEKREEIEKNIKERCGTDNECPNDVKNLLKELKNTDMTKSIDEDKFLNRANSIIVEHNIINKQCGTYSADCKNDAEMNKLLKKVRNIKKPVKEEDALNEAISIIEKIKKEKEKREEIEKNIKERCGADNECPNDVKNLLKELKNTDMTKSIDEDKFLNRANSIIVEHNINKRCGTYSADCKDDAEMNKLLKKVRNIKKPVKEEDALNEATPIIEKITKEKKEREGIENEIVDRRCGAYNIITDCKDDAEMNKLLKKVRNIKKPVKEEDALNEATPIIEKIKKEKEKRKKIKDDIYEERCGIYYINECKADAEMNKLLTKVADIKKPVKEEDALNEAISIIEKITREKEKRIKIEDDIYKQCGIYIDECKDDGDMNGLLKEVADIKISVKRGKILEKAAPIIAKVKEQTDEKEVKRMTDSLKSAVAKAVNKMTEVTSRFTYYKSDSNLPDGVAQVVKNVMAMVKEAVKEVRSTRVKAVEEEARAKNMSLTSSNITNILNVNEWKKTPLAQQLLQLAKEVVSVAEEVELAEARKEAEDWIKLKEPAMMNKLQEAEELVMLIKTEAMVEALRLRGTKRADTPAKMDKEQMAVWALVEVSVEEMLKKERVKGISSKKERDATEDLKRDALAMWEVRKMMMRITWGAKE